MKYRLVCDVGYTCVIHWLGLGLVMVGQDTEDTVRNETSMTNWRVPCQAHTGLAQHATHKFDTTQVYVSDRKRDALGGAASHTHWLLPCQAHTGLAHHATHMFDTTHHRVHAEIGNERPYLAPLRTRENMPSAW